MAPKLFKQSEGVDRKISDSYTISNYLTASDSENVSLAVGSAVNHYESTKSSSDRVYYVLEGQIIVDKRLVGQSGDVIYIPKNTSYEFEGSFKAIIVNSPSFKKENEDIKNFI